MVLAINKIIPGVTEASTGNTCEIATGNSDNTVNLIRRLSVDIASNGEVNIPVAGFGLSEGDNVRLLVHNYTNHNYGSAGSSLSWTTVIEDGTLPPPLPSLLKVVALGDSLTEIGSSLSTAGDNLRPSNQSISTYARGYWVSALLASCESDYHVLDAQGHSGYTTAQILAFGKMTPILNSDADVVMVMLGANDVADVRPDLDIQADYLEIINQILGAGKSVFIVPCTYMNRVADLGSENTQIDTLNAWLLNLANNTAGVEIGTVCAEFNAGVMSDPPGSLGDNYPGWTSDGIHPTNKGGNALGRCIAPDMDAAYPSYMEAKANLIPAFSGTGGQVPYGNGTVPDLWKGFKAVSWEAGINLGDGKEWVKVVTNGSGTISNSNNKAELSMIPADIPEYLGDGLYIAEFPVRLLDAGALNKLRITINSVSATYGVSEFTAFTPNVDGAYADGEYRFRTLPMRLGTEGLLEIELDTTQGVGDNCIMYIADPLFYKVEDI